MDTNEIKVGHGYYMGASSSPDYVLVLSVDERRARVVKPYGQNASYGIELGSLISLVRRAHKTMTDHAANITDPSTLEAFSERFARHGAPSTPADFDRYHVTVKPVAGVWDSLENWRAAEEHGNVGGDIESELLEIETRGEMGLDKIKADPRFVVVSVKMTEECPRS